LNSSSNNPRLRCARLRFAKCAANILLLFSTTILFSQTSETPAPIPILTGNAGFFTNIQSGTTEIVPEINPVLLLPLGDHWLIESKGEFVGDFQPKYDNGPYGGSVDKELLYLQADYIANPYVTVTVGRFLTPFGIYNERLYPIWIRSLQPVPLVYPIEEGSSNGAMLRGGFPLNSAVNLSYAAYFSTLTTTNGIDSDRSAGGRMGFFFPRPRVEAGMSWQKSLQDERTNTFGFHFAWQPPAVPVNLRSEYVRSYAGSGYWIEAAYRLSQLNFWQHAMRRTEIVGRAQQFFLGQGGWPAGGEYELPWANAQEADFGANYFLRDGLKATASYGHQFSSSGDFNLWTVGIAYRFAVALGPAQ
jgi:hypothetical protein